MSSKYSPKEKLSRDLENSVEQAAELAAADKDILTMDEAAALNPELFTFAEYDELEAERIG